MSINCDSPLRFSQRFHSEFEDTPPRKVPKNSPNQYGKLKRPESSRLSLPFGSCCFMNFTSWLSSRHVTLDSRIGISPYANRYFSPDMLNKMKDEASKYLSKVDLSKVYLKLYLEEKEGYPFLKLAVMTQESTEEENFLLILMEFEKELPVERDDCKEEEISSERTVAHILIVEDGTIERKILNQMFKMLFIPGSYEIHEVTTGFTALENAYDSKIKYDLILLDTDLPPEKSGEKGPEIKGPKVAAIIRSFDEETPIISISSNTDKESVEQCKLSGMNDFCPKPFNRARLLECIRTYLPANRLPTLPAKS